jgi:amino acid transporter
MSGERSRDDDEHILHGLGYAQVLYREMGGFSNFAISFTIISILAGCLTSYFIAFNNGGPVAITWGWLIVGFFCILVGLAMGEIASSMPTAGAIYYWSSKLGKPIWGWFSGWFNLIGQIAVTAAIDYGAAIFWTSLLNLWFPGQVGTDTHTVFVTFTVIMALHFVLNLNGVRLLALLNSISAWWHMAGVAVIVAVLIVVPDHHQSIGFVFGETINNSGFSGASFVHPVFWFVFGIGLLMAQYTITGFDASAHMSEETRMASRAAAWGVVMSIVVSVIFGFVLLVAVTFAVPDVEGTLAAGGNAVTYIWQTSLGSRWAEFLLLIACVAQFFCGAASVTAASRMLFAFSRDGAVPGRTLWRKVSRRNRVPVNAVSGIVVFSWALMLPTLWNGAIGYLVGTSVAVIGLYMAFAIPIYLRWRHGENFEAGGWNNGSKYKWMNLVAVAEIVIVSIYLMLPFVPGANPFNDAFEWKFVNYAPVVTVGALVILEIWWEVSAKKWFTGPKHTIDEAVLEAFDK